MEYFPMTALRIMVQGAGSYVGKSVDCCRVLPAVQSKAILEKKIG